MTLFYNLLAEEEINSSALYVSAVLLVAGILFIAFFCDVSKKKIDTRCIAYAGISVALSAVLSLITIFRMPQGGSVTLASLLPILLFSYMYGTKKGLAAGVILGVLNFIIDPWFVHPAQFALDYPMAFGAIGLTGMFRKISFLDKRTRLCFGLGAATACIIRYVCHVISGIYAFATYATMDLLLYSMAYNSFVFIDAAIAVFVGISVLSSKSIVKFLSPDRIKKNNEDD